MGRVLHVLRFGSTLVRYSTGEALQEGLAEARHGRLVPDTLLVLQVQGRPEPDPRCGAAGLTRIVRAPFPPAAHAGLLPRQAGRGHGLPRSRAGAP